MSAVHVLSQITTHRSHTDAMDRLERQYAGPFGLASEPHTYSHAILYILQLSVTEWCSKVRTCLFHAIQLGCLPTANGILYISTSILCQLHGGLVDPEEQQSMIYRRRIHGSD